MHPHLFQFGRLVLPTYGFLVALGTILSLLVCVRTARLLSLDTDKIWSVALLAIVTALVASSILLILLRWPRLQPWYSDWPKPRSLPSTGVLYALHLGLPIRRTADAFAPSLALGSAVAAIGCLEAGCDYGTPTHLPWAVVFTSPAAAPGTPLGVALHPTQLYASMVQFVLFVLLAVAAASPSSRWRNPGCLAFPRRSLQLSADLSARRRPPGHAASQRGDGARGRPTCGCIAPQVSHGG